MLKVTVPILALGIVVAYARELVKQVVKVTDHGWLSSSCYVVVVWCGVLRGLALHCCGSYGVTYNNEAIYAASLTYSPQYMFSVTSRVYARRTQFRVGSGETRQGGRRLLSSRG